MNIALLIFIICTTANVIVGTIKSVATIKGSKISAAFWNAASYGLYSYIVILTANADISTVAKVVVTIACNLVCVYGVKLVEEKMRKDKLWKWELTIPAGKALALHQALKENSIPHNYNEVYKWAIFNVFAETQTESAIIEKIADEYGAKTFATETKII